MGREWGGVHVTGLEVELVGRASTVRCMDEDVHIDSEVSGAYLIFT
jgi:regulator of RNase E activity RraA